MATHPIQYQIPWFAGLAAHGDVRLKVYFAHLPDPVQQGTGFGVPLQWDIPMLDGYAWEQLENVRRSPDLSSFFGSSTPAIFSVLARDRPDAVVVTGWNTLPLLQALWACMRLGIPRVVRGDSNALRQRPYLIRAAHRLILARYDAFLLTGASNRDFYRRYGISSSGFFDARHFVDNARFREAAKALAPERGRIRRDWRIPDDATCFLFAGKLQPKKRLFDLLDAMHRLEPEPGQRHLLVVGMGEQLEDAKALVAQWRIPATFAGFLNQKEMPRAYVAADCIVLPSDYGETWGLVVNEAMACGLPAVVSDRVGCGPDLIVEGKTGHVFPFGDVAALAKRMRLVEQDSGERARMGQRACEHIGAYSVKQAVQGTVAAVRHVVARGGTRLNS